MPAQNSHPARKLATKERIIAAVAKFYSLEVTDLTGKTRSAEIAKARQVAMHIIREQTGHTLISIGQALGGRDHTTIMHGLHKIEQTLQTNPTLRQEIFTITQNIYKTGVKYVDSSD